ncbi:MAG: AEC family transporter [Deltaproteobacteria bacterium]|nr:AEC family transporter [Deltaproteobacteria bacterium]
MHIVLTILPLFLVIGLGAVGARLGLLPPAFVGPANRLAFYLAIPALLFRALAHAPAGAAFQPLPAVITVTAMLLGWAAALGLSRLFFPPGRSAARASWLHVTFHGNQGLMALAVIYYALGQAGLSAGGLVIAVVIIVQNLMAVVTLTRWGSREETPSGHGAWFSFVKNPIIVSSALGLGVSLAGWPLPAFVDQTLKIMADLGMPLALLIIGATLQEKKPGGAGAWRLVPAVGLKLLVLPLVGYGLLRLAGVPHLPLTVAVILLAAPTATLTVILADQLGGDRRQASAAVTLSHGLAMFTYTAWLWFLHA